MYYATEIAFISSKSLLFWGDTKLAFHAICELLLSGSSKIVYFPWLDTHYKYNETKIKYVHKPVSMRRNITHLFSRWILPRQPRHWGVEISSLFLLKQEIIMINSFSGSGHFLQRIRHETTRNNIFIVIPKNVFAYKSSISA